MPLVNPAVKGEVTMIAEGLLGSPRVSGNGKVVVWNQWVDDPELGDNLEIMKFEEGKVDRVTFDPRPDMQADLSYDGKVIAWNRFSVPDTHDPNGTWDIYQWRDGVESPVAATDAQEMSAAVSRDGKVIAFDTDEQSYLARWNIHKWENGKVEAVTEGDGSRQFPFLTSDGHRVYWQEFSEDKREIYMRDETGAVQPVITSPGSNSSPSVTPDGSTLLWTNDALGDDDLLQMKGGEINTVAGERQVDETWATMSADGKVVAWTAFDWRNGEPAAVNVFLKDGETVTQLTTDGRLHAFPHLSDDGKTIVWLDVTNPEQARLYKLDRE